jgi:uncharacterized protein (TIGR03067 family)
MMLPNAFVCAAGLAVALGAAALHGDSGKSAGDDKIRALIKQLGDDAFAKREAASKKLETIGMPALAALRAAATSSGDAEIRQRARALIRAITARAWKAELKKWQGYWETKDGVWMKFTGERWSSGTPTFGPVAGTFQVQEIRGKLALADLLVDEGPTKGLTCKAIFRLDGDTLHYCGTYRGERPTTFKTVESGYSGSFKRVKK